MSVRIMVDAILHETDDAILVLFADEEIWLPLSQVDAIERSVPPIISMARWLAAEKGMLE